MQHKDLQVQQVHESVRVNRRVQLTVFMGQTVYNVQSIVLLNLIVFVLDVLALAGIGMTAANKLAQ